MNNQNTQGQRQRRLVLHFDINNTILMKDSSKGLNSVQMNVSKIDNSNFTFLTCRLPESFVSAPGEK